MNFLRGDAALLPFADASVDLIFGSPPYMDCRTYGRSGVSRKCNQWISWMMQVTEEAVRVSRGLVLWVVAGVTRKHTYWPGPEGLLYEWWKRGGHCWRPAYWHRVGIPGSGGKQWLRADVEYVMAFKRPGPLPWADNTANGHTPKWAPGGEMSYRLSDGQRKNGLADPWLKRGRGNNLGGRDKHGRKLIGTLKRHRQENGTPKSVRRCTRGKIGGDTIQEDAYIPPVLANPGNLICGIKVGGGHMGHDLAHDNEAPFPEKLAAWFIRSWCPPNGLCLDPFSGSGSTVAAAEKLGRQGIGLDIRESQVILGMRRLASGIDRELFVG